MTLKQLLPTIAISAAASVTSICIYGGLLQKSRPVEQTVTSKPGKFAGYPEDGNSGGPVDFTQAASFAAPAVVHRKTHTTAQKVSNTQPKDDPFGQLFGQQQPSIPAQTGSGSGVILSEDGYIVTNQHVIASADNITVSLANGRVW
jgi:serine protease Do